jgi:hypothetical protein
LGLPSQYIADFICGFENNQVEICGRVEEIGFTYGKN